MEFNYQHQDWSNLKVLGRNRMPVRPFYTGWQSKEDARTKKKEESGKYTCLRNMEICLFYTPFLVPEGAQQKCLMTANGIRCRFRDIGS